MITVFGSINVDLIFALDRLPGPGETVLAPTMRLEPGGKGANQAVAAALDGTAVAMAGAVGDDAWAEIALAELRAAGVDLSRVRGVAGATGCATICTDGAGQNQIVVASGANQAARADQVETALLKPGHVVLLQMEVDPRETAALIRRSSGARLILNLAPALQLPIEAFTSVDVLVVNEHEAAWLADHFGSGTTVDALHSRLGCVVVRTAGAAGCDFHGAAGGGHVPAVPVRAIDTTGAGDCFTGVMAAGLSRGLRLEAALLRASAAASLCCTRAGSQVSLPRAPETDAMLAGQAVPVRSSPYP